MQEQFSLLAIANEAPGPSETGGTPENLNFKIERNIARAAEFLVAYDISRRGFDVFTVGEGLRYDLIADIGGIRRIQVKSRKRPELPGPGSITPAYRFGDKDGLRRYENDVDAFAFVATDLGVIYYAPARQSWNFLIKAAQMTHPMSDLSWWRLLHDWDVG